MHPESIFVPVGVLGLWTGLILVLTGGKRLRAIKTRRMKASALAYGESDEVPLDVSLFNRNLMNLLEMPVLFYVAALSLFVTHHVNANIVNLCWAFVALRIVHSVIHVTYNNVFHRFVMFLSSNIVLLVLWITFFRSVLR